MLPLFGDKNSFLYADLTGDYATDDTYLASPGTGYRQVADNQIVGAYFFGDYQRTNLSENFWDLSPGIEWMNPRWDAHINAYFPTTKSKQSGPTDFADNYGDYSHVSFRDGTHDQYDALVTPYAMIGNGVDAEVGYSLPNARHLRSRVYLGSYYYQPPSQVNSIRGITLGFQKALSDNVSVNMQNSYDQVSNYTVALSLSLSLGGHSNTFSDDVQDRLLDPVDRHIGIIGTGSGTYAQQGLKVEDADTLEYNNVYFISPGGTGDGSYGNPAALSQATLDNINTSSPNSARLYLQGDDTYNITASHLDPYNGQNFYGRTYNYTAPAEGNARPLLYQPTSGNSIFLLGEHGNSTNEFSNLRFNSNYTPGGGGSGIYAINNTTNATINNCDFSYFDGGALYFANAEANINVANSTFNNNSVAINYTPAEGDLNIENSVISVDSDFDDGTGTFPSGIVILNGGIGTLNFNANNLQILFNDDPAAAQGISIQNIWTGEVNADINDLTLTGSSHGVGSSAIEIYNGNGAANGGTVNVTIRNSLIDNNGNNGGYGNIYIDANNGGVTNFNFINSVSSNGASYGLLVHNNNLDDTVNVTIRNSVFSNSGVTLPGFPFGNISLWSQGRGDINLSATNSTISNTTGSVPALWVSNEGGTGSNIDVTNLTGTCFLNNASGGIYAYGNTGTSTTINYSGATFVDSTPNTATDPTSTGTITWIS